MLTGAAAARGSVATLGDDGMWHEAWFVQSSLDLAEDLAAALAAGKRRVVMWELRNCPYCRLTHEVNFADAAIADFVRDHFDVVQLDILGARPVTFPDGARLPEKAQAARQGIQGTLAFQFFGVGGAEVARFASYREPRPFLEVFRFVQARDHERGPMPAGR